MKKMIVTLILHSFFFGQSYTQTISPARPLDHLRVSKDRRSLVHENGSPFFWLADTGWELFHRLDKQDVDFYFKKRAEQGFTVIQAVALAEMDGLHTPNAYGELPLENDDPSKPRKAYFQYVEWIIDKAAYYGLYIALLPTWADKVFKDRWGKGPEIFNSATAKAYGQWIGNRFKDKSNIIWILGGDRNPRNESDVEIWRAMAAGVAEGVHNPDNTLMTYHPQPSETSSSSPWFHKDDWLDFNMLQTGHCRDTKVWEKISRDYNLQPTKPTLNGESIYEDHPVCFKPKELGYSNAYDIRKAAYLSVFAGSAGYTYGCHAVWQFYSHEREGVNGPLKTWKISLDLPAASQVKYLKRLISTIPESCRPAQQILLDTLDGTQRIQALQANGHVLVYSAAGEPFRLNNKVVNLKNFGHGYWYDPRTGKQQLLSKQAIQTDASFVPPAKGDGNDWVLVLF